MRSMYKLTQFTGQIEILSGQESIENCLRGPECCAFLGRPSVNDTLESDTEMESRRIDKNFAPSKKRTEGDESYTFTA